MPASVPACHPPTHVCPATESQPDQASFIPLHGRVKAARLVAASPNRRFAAVLEELFPANGDEQQQQQQQQQQGAWQVSVYGLTSRKLLKSLPLERGGGGGGGGSQQAARLAASAGGSGAANRAAAQAAAVALSFR
jgi:hypothetical protein